MKTHTLFRSGGRPALIPLMLIAVMLIALMQFPVLVLAATPVVQIETAAGEFFIELTPDVAPRTVANFLTYVRAGDYSGSLMHRSVPGFVVQGGGFTFDEATGAGPPIATNPPVANEFNVSNQRGTVAMARLGGQPDSATNQWFVNLADNSGLDSVDGGFTVFGRVRGEGMAVPDAIAQLPRFNFGSPFNELPTINYPGSGPLLAANLVLVSAITELELVAAPFASVLPGGRSVQTGQAASAFATIVNAADSVAASCGLSVGSEVSAQFSFQTTDALTNVTTGVANERVDIAPGAAQSFVFFLTPTAELNDTLVEIDFGCGNSDLAPALAGLNTFSLSASAAATADLIALAATPSNDGIAAIPGAAGTGVFSVASVNVGAADLITVSADTGAVDLPVNVFVCETDPVTGACLSDLALSVSRQFEPNETPTFSFFIQGGGSVEFDPAVNRVFVRFRDQSGNVRGATSVAVSTTP